MRAPGAIRLDYLLLVGALLLLLLGPPSILAQTDAVSLRLKLDVGESLFYAEIGSVQVTVENSAGLRRTSEVRYESRNVIRVLEARALGAMLIEYAVEDYRVTEAGTTTDRLLPALTFRVDPDGKVVERLVSTDERLDFPFPLPGRPVRAGESWTRETTTTSAEITVKGTGAYTLAGVAAAAEGPTARIRFHTEGIATTGQTFLGLQTQTRMNVTGSGEYEWLLERGRHTRYSSDMVWTANTQVSFPGLTGSSRVSSKTGIRGVPLSPDSIGSPPAEVAIQPGQGVGPFTLSMTVDGLAGRLGTSDFREFGLGFIAYSRQWRNGLVAYVASDDNNKVIGLETNDGQFRTTKGLKVGSSRGAVLLTHGRTPQEVEMTIPGKGPIRILVYNDQGIAFAVTSEFAAGSQTVSRIPIGLVNWITVFPPGDLPLARAPVGASL